MLYSLTLRLSLAGALLTLKSCVPRGREESVFLLGKVLLMMKSHLLRATQQPSTLSPAFLFISPDPCKAAGILPILLDRQLRLKEVTQVIVSDFSKLPCRLPAPLLLPFGFIHQLTIPQEPVGHQAEAVVLRVMGFSHLWHAVIQSARGSWEGGPLGPRAAPLAPADLPHASGPARIQRGRLARDGRLDPGHLGTWNAEP